MRFLTLFFPAVLTAGSLAASGGERTVRSIRFEGVEALRESELSDLMTLRPGGQFSAPQLSRDLQSISAKYSHDGYPFADVRASVAPSAADSSGTVVITVDEGPYAPVGWMRFSGNSLFDEGEILRSFETHAGAPLKEDVLEKDLSDLLQRYEKSGYPLARATLRKITPVKDSSGTRLGVEIGIVEGPLSTIDEIRVTGNRETKEQVILRENRISPHETYNPDKIARISPRLNRLNIFSRVDEPEFYLGNKGEGGLLIRVMDGNSNSFDGILGYSPSGSGEEEVTGFVTVTMRNLFGTARKLNVRWQRDQRNTQETGVQYVEPWLFGFPLNLAGGFSQRQQDTLYVQRTVEAKADLLLSETVSLGLSFSVEDVIPTAGSTPPAVSKSRSTSAGIDVHYDTRDDIISPTTGVNYRTGYQLGSKRISEPSPYLQAPQQVSTVRRISIDADLFVKTLERQVLALGLHGRERSGGDLELGDLYRLGGTNSLRGYRENQFLGSRIAWTNTEYRFILARRSYFYGFFDSGYSFLPGIDPAPSSQFLKYGYGVGIRLETSLGNIGVNLGFGEGDSFTEGKIHIGLFNEF